MSRKHLIWILMTVGTYLGSWVPSLWGSASFSVSGVFLGAVGGIAGIWLAFKISE